MKFIVRTEHSPMDRDTSSPSQLRTRLDQPVPFLWRVIGWLSSSILFYTILFILGGPSEADAPETVYSTWAIAHGNLSCAYPIAPTHHLVTIADPFAAAAPLYSILTGIMAAILRIGHQVPFPSAAQLGQHCSNGFTSMFQWSMHSGIIVPTIRLSYVVWPILAMSVVALLRANGRGRTGWESFALIMLSLTSPLYMALVEYFHPQDVLALALILFSVAQFQQNKWMTAGFFMGAALLTQQFTLLAVVPLFFLAPSGGRLRLAISATGVFLLINVPLLIATSGRAFYAQIFGSSRISAFQSTAQYRGGTVLWELHLRGLALFLISRLLPILLSALLALWVSRRLGASLTQPGLLLSLLATTFFLRLVFEENLYGYYFMSVAIFMVLVGIVERRIREALVAWLALVTLAFNPVSWGFQSNWTLWGARLSADLPIIAIGIAVAFNLVRLISQRELKLSRLLWIVVTVASCVPSLWGRPADTPILPTWLWQILFVASGLVLATKSLRQGIERSRQLGAAIGELQT